MNFRIFSIVLIFFVSYGVLGYKLYRLQVEDGFYYFERVQARNDRLTELGARRGKIYITDRHDNKITVAMNRDFPLVFASPKDITEPEKTAEILSDIFSLDKESLEVDLSNNRRMYRVINHKTDQETVSKIRELNLKGVYVDENQYRYYPFGDLLSHAIGFLGINESINFPMGLYGVERFYEETLRKGDDVELTIDRSIQSKSEEILRSLVDKYEASGGTVIVQDPSSGKILAMANLPFFDPNDYYDFPVGNFINSSTQLIYEPGSILKTITLASGIDVGALNASTKYIDTGSVTLNRRTIKNWDNKIYGEVTMRDVHENSINTGAVFAGQLIGREVFYEYMKKFGFGEITGIDLPSEVSGTLKSLEGKNARDIDFATASFGQGPAITPIQAINAFSAIANGGLLMRPYLNKSNNPHVIRRVISQEASEEIKDIMVSSVEKNIIGSISGYSIAGKTGTATIPDFKRGGYTDDLIHTFIGFAPASDPKFSILIKLDRPQSVGALAGRTVVPSFRDLAQFILNYYSISPDRIDK